MVHKVTEEVSGGVTVWTPAVQGYAVNLCVAQTHGSLERGGIAADTQELRRPLGLTGRLPKLTNTWIIHVGFDISWVKIPPLNTSVMIENVQRVLAVDRSVFTASTSLSGFHVPCQHRKA